MKVAALVDVERRERRLIAIALDRFLGQGSCTSFDGAEQRLPQPDAMTSLLCVTSSAPDDEHAILHQPACVDPIASGTLCSTLGLVPAEPSLTCHGATFSTIAAPLPPTGQLIV